MKQITFDKFLLLEKALTVDCLQMFAKAPKPEVLAGKPVPQNLNGMTLGQLAQLKVLGEKNVSAMEVVTILLEVTPDELMKAPAADVIGFMTWAGQELEHIMKLFKSTEIPPTPEETEARVGIKNAGIFGLVDWYARRMGYKDHEEVFALPWPRVYKCLEIDAENEKLKRRINDIYNRKLTHKRR